MTYNRGFTLLELLVSVSAIAIMGVLLSQVFITTLRSNTKNEITKEVKQNGDIALNVITRMVQNATDVTSTCESAGTTGPSFTLTNVDAGSSTFGCVDDGTGVLRVASTSAATTYLTSPAVTLVGADCTTAFTATCTLLPSGVKSIHLSFSLAQKGTVPDMFNKASETFDTTVSVRSH